MTVARINIGDTWLVEGYRSRVHVHGDYVTLPSGTKVGTLYAINHFVILIFYCSFNPGTSSSGLCSCLCLLLNWRQLFWDICRKKFPHSKKRGDRQRSDGFLWWATFPVSCFYHQSINQRRWRMQAPKCLYIRIVLSTLYSYSNQPNNYLYTQFMVNIDL